MYREFKFVVQPVLLIEEDGDIVGERAADTMSLYGLVALKEFCDSFPDDLKKLNERSDV